jgi:hypothetical protein
MLPQARTIPTSPARTTPRPSRTALPPRATLPLPHHCCHRESSGDDGARRVGVAPARSGACLRALPPVLCRATLLMLLSWRRIVQPLRREQAREGHCRLVGIVDVVVAITSDRRRRRHITRVRHRCRLFVAGPEFMLR